MSQVTHPTMPLSAQLKSHRLVALAGLLALLGAAAVALVLAIGDGPSTTSVAERPLSTARADGGPEESSVAVAVASRGPAASPLTVARYDGGPEEGAAALTARSAPATSAPSAITSAARPDESAVAAAIGSTEAPARPDESTVAAAISGTE